MQVSELLVTTSLSRSTTQTLTKIKTKLGTGCNVERSWNTLKEEMSGAAT